jgi:hypothetical protein
MRCGGRAWFDDKNPGAMSLKLSTDEGNHFGLIPKTKRSAMQRNETTAILNEIQ